MTDVAPALQVAIEKDFNRMLARSDKIKSITKLMESGTATYVDANDYAIEIGRILSEAFQMNLSSAVLPDGKMYFNIADRILGSTLGNNHKLISSATAQIQEGLNKAAGIGIKALQVPLNKDRIKGFVDRISSEELYDSIAWILGEPVVNYSQSIVDDTIKANAELHHRAGLGPKIVRRAAGGCCEWCDEVAGTYAYPDVPEEIYRRHDRCRCFTTYDPGDGKRQDVYSKRWL